MPLPLRRKVDLGFAVALAVLAVTGAVAIRSARQLWEAGRWATESAVRSGALKELFADVVASETSRRGWVLTRDPNQLEDCRAALAQVERAERSLERLVAGDAVQSGRLELLRPLVAAKVEHVRTALALPADSQGSQREITRRGTELRDAIRAVVREMESEESRRLAARLSQARVTARTTTAVVLATGLFAFALVAVGLYRIRRDVERRERAEEARRRTEEELRRLEAIVEATPDVIGIARPDGTLVWLNRSGREAIGLAGPGEGPAPSAFSFYAPWAQERLRVEAIPAAIRDGFWIGDTALAIGSKEVACSQVILAHRGASGEVAFLSTILRDISERKEVERLRRELVATVSHELKTPLTAIKGAIDVVLDGGAGEVSAPALQLLEIARRNGERLGRLVRDIVDVERMEDGAVAFDLRPALLAPVVEGAVEAFRPFADAAGVHVSFEARAPEARSRVDADRIGQVVTNLLSNAVKFSPRGASVEVVLERRGDSLRIEVSDRGRGIPDSFRSRLFTRFAQADPGDRKEKGGSGLGLAISKAIVERHGGRIGFAARPGGGTTFFVELHELREAIAARQASGTVARVLRS